MNQSDEILARQLLDEWYEGSTRALAELLELDAIWIRRRASVILPASMRSEFDSGDMVQEGLLRILKFRPTYPPESLAQFRALVGGALQQAAIDEARRHGAQKRIPRTKLTEHNSAVDRVEFDTAGPTPPDLRAERSEDRERMVLALELIEPSHREVIELRTFRGLSFPEISERLGVTVGAATMRFQRASESLRKAYEGLGKRP